MLFSKRKNIEFLVRSLGKSGAKADESSLPVSMQRRPWGSRLVAEAAGLAARALQEAVESHDRDQCSG